VPTVDRGLREVVRCSLLHLLEELPRVRGQGLDVATLSFREDGVERERRFPRTGNAGDHDKLVAGNDDINVLEIVLARAANDDGVHR